MGLGTSPTMTLTDRIRIGDEARLWVTNLGPEVAVHLERHYDVGEVEPKPLPIIKKGTLPAGGSMRLALDAGQVPLKFDKSGRSIVQGQVVADSQPAVLMVTMQRIDRTRRTSVVAGWAQLVALGPAAGKAVPLAAVA